VYLGCHLILACLVGLHHRWAPVSLACLRVLASRLGHLALVFRFARFGLVCRVARALLGPLQRRGVHRGLGGRCLLAHHLSRPCRLGRGCQQILDHP
jgi:hypothetical protein